MKKFLPLLAVFVLCLSLCVPASAIWYSVLEAPSLDSVWTAELKAKYPYCTIVEEGGNQLKAICTPQPLVVRYAVNTSTGQSVPTGVVSKEVIPYVEFILQTTDGGQNSDTWGFWYETLEPTSKIYKTSQFSEDRIATNYDLMSELGSTLVQGASSFFPTPPIPLAEVIQGVTTETLTETTVPALGQTVSTVVLCGVGCLALLMVLVLFGKRSQIFHI